jgi:hypothetical protein
LNLAFPAPLQDSDNIFTVQHIRSYIELGFPCSAATLNLAFHAPLQDSDNIFTVQHIRSYNPHVPLYTELRSHSNINFISNSVQSSPVGGRLAAYLAPLYTAGQVSNHS